MDADRDEALLDTVVEVAFDLAPFGVAGDDDPRARLTEVTQRVVPCRVELGVLRRQQRDDARGTEQLGVVGKLRVVVDRGPRGSVFVARRS